MENLLLQLRQINEVKKNLEKQEKEIKKKLETECLSEDGYKSDFVTVSYSKPTTSTTIDIDKLKEKEPQLYDDLIADYPKETTRKGSYRYTFK